MRIITSLLTLSFFATLSLGAATAGAQALEVEPNRMQAHVEFLASDQLRGRKPGTPGYRIAAEYVASQFLQLGLETGGDSGSYFQSVPLREYTLVNGSSRMEVRNGADTRTLEFSNDYVMWGSATRDKDLLQSETVFVGYGIVSPQFDHDDYADLDVKGKIVVTLAGRPKAWPTEEGAHLASGTEKRRHAAERGARGMISLHTPRREKILPWKQMQLYASIPSMAWLNTDGTPDGVMEPLSVSVVLKASAADYLFAGSGLKPDDIYDADLAGEAIQTGDLSSSVTLARKSTRRDFTSANVAGIVRGSDPALAGEYLLYTAHLDHLGVVEATEGEDKIHNGAMDNATGVATMLEMARVLQAERSELKRSVMFLAVTAEELGLLGAGYYAGNPTVPLKSIIANVNLDMPLLTYPFADVVAFGAQHSDLKMYVERAAKKADITLSPDTMPEQGLFVRSDHYKLVQKGIPAVFLATAFNSRNPDQDAAQVWGDFLEHHYHKPSDDTRLPIDYAAAAVFGEINVNIGREICNASQAPKWNEGDFFGDLFSGD